MILRAPEGQASLSDLVEGRVSPEPLGSIKLVQDTILELAPEADLSEGAFAHIDIERGYVGIAIGEDEPCTDLLCEVRGADEAAVDLVAGIAHRLGAHVVIGDSRVDDIEDMRKSFREWRTWSEQSRWAAQFLSLRLLVGE